MVGRSRLSERVIDSEKMIHKCVVVQGVCVCAREQVSSEVLSPSFPPEAAGPASYRIQDSRLDVELSASPVAPLGVVLLIPSSA